MAISGVPIPAAEGAQVPFFRAVHADIGDEQAIAQNLSTFSSHVQRIARCVAHAAPDALVLLDELGAGTDPGGGFRARLRGARGAGHAKVFAVVTTHLGRLKDFAYQHPGAENGSMAFDGETLRPLYRLDLGIPGNSHALDIAARVGMPKGIVDRARQLLGKRDATLDNLIEKVQVARRDAEADRQHTADRSREVDKQHKQLEQKLAEAVKKENWLQEEADGVVEAELRKAQAGAAGAACRAESGARPARRARARAARRWSTVCCKGRRRAPAAHGVLPPAEEGRHRSTCRGGGGCVRCARSTRSASWSSSTTAR